MIVMKLIIIIVYETNTTNSIYTPPSEYMYIYIVYVMIIIENKYYWRWEYYAKEPDTKNTKRVKLKASLTKMTVTKGFIAFWDVSRQPSCFVCVLKNTQYWLLVLVDNYK